MAENVEVSDVRKIIETDVEDDAIEDAYLKSARRMFADHLAGEGISDATEFEIVRYLAAHYLAATRDIEAGSAIEFGADTVRVRVGGALRGGIFGPGLRLTRYGMLAVELDPTGILASIAEGKTAATFAVVELPDPDE